MACLPWSCISRAMPAEVTLCVCQDTDLIQPGTHTRSQRCHSSTTSTQLRAVRWDAADWKRLVKQEVWKRLYLIFHPWLCTSALSSQEIIPNAISMLSCLAFGTHTEPHEQIPIITNLIFMQPLLNQRHQQEKSLRKSKDCCDIRGCTFYRAHLESSISFF